MVILGSQNKITDFFVILAWASPFKRHTAEAVYAKDLINDAVPIWDMPMDNLTWTLYESDQATVETRKTDHLWDWLKVVPFWNRFDLWNQPIMNGEIGPLVSLFI